MIKFIWSIVKQLPLPLLFAVGLALGMFLLWAAAHVFTVKYLVCGLFVVVTLLFTCSICVSSKKKPCCHYHHERRP
jgi:hypothetical protein